MYPKDFTDPAPAKVTRNWPDAGHFFQDLALSPLPTVDETQRISDDSSLILDSPVKTEKTKVKKPAARRRLNGKQMIPMIEPGFQTEKKRKKRKNEKDLEQMKSKPKPKKCKTLVEDEEFKLGHMERFVSVMFCKGCQDGTRYDGKTLTIDLCDRCGRRANSFESF